MLGGFTLVILAILTQGNLMLFMSFSSILIVGGGVFCSAIIHFSISEVRDSFSILMSTLTQSKTDLRTDIELMNMFVRKVRRDGILSLEEDIRNIDEPFLRTGMQYVLDGVNKETMLKILDDQLKSAERMLNKSVNVLSAMAEYSPAFGMIGTVIGLILMLQNIDDPESLGQGLAVALLTTLYGTMSANMIFTPIAGKLDHLGEKQLIRKEMFRSAIISLLDEENPRFMENKMLNFVTPLERAEYLAYYENQSFNKQREEKLYANWKEYQFISWQDLTGTLEAG